MQEETSAFLRQAGLEAYIKDFEDNEILPEQLLSLPDSGSVFQELIPKAGHRVKFIQALQKLNKEDTDTSSSRSVSTSESSGSSVVITNLSVCPNGEAVVESIENFPVITVEGEEPEALNLNEQSQCTVIKNIARKSLDGLMVLAAWEEKKQFDHSHRIKLAKLIVHDEFQLDAENDITAHRFKFLADCIRKEFGEDPKIWYDPSRTEDDSTVDRPGPSHRSTSIPTGKLYDQYTNLTKELRKHRLRDSRRGLKRSADDSLLDLNEQRLATLPPNNLSEDDMLHRLTCLETEINDWDLIRRYWKDTVRARYESLTTGEGLLCDYLNKYPALKQEKGYKLLELDFQALFPQAFGRIWTHWDEFVEKVKDQLRIENIKIPAPCSDAELLHLYAKLFTPVPLKVPKGRAWKPSRNDVLDGFLCHLKTDDLCKFWESIEARNRAKGLTVQPFPMIIGPSISSIHTYYFVVDKTPLKLNSTKEALAAAFYAYHALYCSYPLQSARLWVVLERALFGMDNVEDPQSRALSHIPEVKRLISVLKV